MTISTEDTNMNTADLEYAAQSQLDEVFEEVEMYDEEEMAKLFAQK